MAMSKGVFFFSFLFFLFSRRCYKSPTSRPPIKLLPQLCAAAGRKQERKRKENQYCYLLSDMPHTPFYPHTETGCRQAP
ncbi:uncharacterized protein LY79DRAFT_547399 [Colletotrichum navitas]|uniref:Secreted protein n=1 Tax=Colletotrichum navitas TaxID=681940 RepID=A0AAD8V842_9PEZI|nr:uncharacterized protein LY79DRAFT_547399 [Colletotrichum navitas]KAK1595326.1 hypothetical protein LY79DRAFT_547399 [Colletotrichum navitas]